MPPTSMKQAAMVISSLRPIYRDKSAGTKAPKNAPEFSRATTFDDTSADLTGIVESLNSTWKLQKY